MIFGYQAIDPHSYCIVSFDEYRNVLSIEEKPEHPNSQLSASAPSTSPWPAYSPERINPGDKEYTVEKIKKVTPVKGARALMLGITIKENCPEIRNTGRQFLCGAQECPANYIII